VNPRELFQAMADILPGEVRRDFPQHAGPCILSTRVAIEVAAYFAIEAQPVPCQVVLYNAAFARHVHAGDEMDVERWHAQDGSHSVGIGFHKRSLPDKYNGHLIAVAGDTFGDFTISQGERLGKDIVTGQALVGPYTGTRVWRAENERGTVIEYKRFEDTLFRQAPDWKDEGRRRPIVGRVIRELKRARAVNA
jgi:hypothetical protein